MVRVEWGAHTLNMGLITSKGGARRVISQTQYSHLKSQTSHLKHHTSTLTPQASNFKPPTSNLKPQTSNRKPRTTNLNLLQSKPQP